MRCYISGQISDAQRGMSAMLADNILLSTLGDVAETSIVCIKQGGKTLLAGNGGSAADTQNIAGEFVSRFAFDRPGLPAITLTTETSILTPIGNDHSYEEIFAHQLQALGNKRDIFISYSTSGKSPNVLRDFEVAKCKA